MNFSSETLFHGFSLIKENYYDDLKGTLYLFEHTKTGTRLCWLRNDNDNKVFNIAFKTIPSDNTGVFHILEHTVLNGSENYPVKEPFVELMKGSMNTFLNAMTFPDKTVYPVSSRNDKDFHNLVSVYLDAVFKPNLLSNRNIFLQEGWHLEKDTEGLKYNGVVYNEMKGALESPSSVEFQGIFELLFKNNGYRFNSGGDPREIPNLTYEKYIETYKAHYHPSNALIYLDGSIDCDSIFALIDSYLSEFEREDFDIDIETQDPYVDSMDKAYPIIREESTENRTRISFCKIVARYHEFERILAIRALSYLLAGTNEGLLTRKVLKDLVSEDLYVELVSSLKQPVIQIQFINVKDELKDNLYDIYKKYMNEILEEGLDMDYLESIISNMEFRERELQEPQGLMRAVNMLDSWLYDKDLPELYLLRNPVLESLRNRLKTNYFEKLLKEVFLSDDLSSFTAYPSYTVNDEYLALEKESLGKLSKELSEEEMLAVSEDEKALRKWQQTEDKDEDKAKIPSLKISDINKTFRLYNTEVIDKGDVKVLYHNEYTNGIINVSLYFDLSDYSLEELQYICLIPRFYGEFGTAKYSNGMLQRLFKKHFGRINFSFNANDNVNDRKICTPVMEINFSIMRDNLKTGLDLIYEILFENIIDEQTLQYLLLQLHENNRVFFQESGEQFTIRRAQASYSSSAALTEATEGISFINFISSIRNDCIGTADKLKRYQKILREKTFVRNRLTIGLTNDEYIDLGFFTDSLKEGSRIEKRCIYEIQKSAKEAVIVPNRVTYAAKVYSNLGPDFRFDGSMLLSSNIISLDYLWREIRVRNGAYGAGINTRQTGFVISYTYRDPDCLGSLRTIKGVYDYLRAFASTGTDITQYIISAINNRNPLLSPASKGKVADNKYFSGIDLETDLRIMEDIRSSDNRRILENAYIFDSFAKYGDECIIVYNDYITDKEFEKLRIDL